MGLDRDAQALEIARERLKGFEKKVTLVHANFEKLDAVAEGHLDFRPPMEYWRTWAYRACSWISPSAVFHFARLDRSTCA